MKTSIQYIVALFVAVLTFTSCSNNDDAAATDIEKLNLVTKLENDLHTVEIYSETGFLQQGFNDISLRIKDKKTSEYVKDAAISWKPIMHMKMMSHSCPFSTIVKSAENNSIYKGYIVFQMPQNDSEYWNLEINYSIDGASFSVQSNIPVPAVAKRNVTSFTGTDGVKYVLALIEPTKPKVATNDIKIGLWKMENMDSYPIMDGYTIKIDPRMPSMGNHSSPNNTNAIQGKAGDWYNGKLSLTMTGYWKINLQLADKNGTIIKGETVSEIIDSSSLFFEIEF
ncbi:hypothetical protein ACRASX_08000 [Flavobacterium sp. TMP13]|uniref:hypothetical protein n=1 Tax=Flavobacterium sp. TMP13 TaxID=3425950 RepID=UPI003D770892